MEERRRADPKMIIAVQMLSIGVILFILGLTVSLLSPVSRMEPYIRMTFLISVGSILLVGILFSIGGIIRYKRVKRR